jgi:DNA-directed DNA polymerase III PolC
MMPQLRIRTEYSYRSCYGPVERVAEHLAAIGCPAAGVVDTTGTWGHVQWEVALAAAGIKPMFGTEFALESEEGWKQRCWVLAENLASFYRLSSAPPKSSQDMANATGVIRFAGAALTDPDAFDYIDINPRSRMRTAAAIALARHTGKPLVITSDNDYPAPEDRDRFLAWDDSQKMTPQHILTEPELRRAFDWLDDATYSRALANTHEVAERVAGLKLVAAPIISVPGNLAELVEEGRKYRLQRGHIKQWNADYQARLERELTLIKAKEYESYFIVVADMILWAKQRMLVGPARGSSAGSLVCFLLQITEVDPLVHGLIFERFIDVNRNDLPDIDVDFNDQKRELVFDYLAQKYGRENVARIGSVNRLKPRSVIAHVGKKMAIPHGATFGVTNVLIEYSSGDSRYGKGLEDTLTNTQPGKDFMARYPEAAIMGELENHASHSGQHAAGIIVANVPVTEHCTVRDGIAHIDKKDAEHLNLLKIDALGLRTLGVIEDTGCITPQQLYDLELHDPEVFEIFNKEKFSGVFQFEGAAQRRVSIQVPVTSFKQIDHVTALARPGPLGGGAANTYINRNAGREVTTYHHPSMQEYLGDTMGVVLYQEQVMRIVRELGDFSWEDTSTIRKAMSGRKGKEFFDRHGERFVAGASRLGIPKEEAASIWEEICSFGAWGMNKSHTVSYAIISYWCAYMKRYHPLEYAAACLRNAKDEEQTIEILRELSEEGVSFVPFDAAVSAVNWAAVNGKLVGGFTNLVGIGPVKANYYVQKRAAEGLTESDLSKIAKHPVKHQDLRPAHTLWGDLYRDPSLQNVHGPIKEFKDLADGESAVVICKLIRQERRDENETVRLARRGYAKKGQTLFLDAFVVDDSVSKPVVARLKSALWNNLGEPMADRAVPGADWFLIRGRWLAQFSMLSVEKIKCLTNPEMFK